MLCLLCLTWYYYIIYKYYLLQRSSSRPSVPSKHRQTLGTTEIIKKLETTEQEQEITEQDQIAYVYIYRHFKKIMFTFLS